jgi:hypothetical protein
VNSRVGILKSLLVITISAETLIRDEKNSKRINVAN